MAPRSEQTSGVRGLSVRQLTLIFLGAVGVSAMFFALGFLVGNNRRSASAAPNVEQVSPPGEIPPTVNPPVQNSQNTPSVQDSAPGGAPPIVEQNINSQAVSSGKSPSNRKTPALSAAPASVATPLAEPGAPLKTPPHAQTAPGDLTLQVAALHTQREARSLVRRLRKQKFAAVLLTSQEAGTHDRIYRVQVGPFSSRRAALAAQKRLRRGGFKSFIKKSQ